ncbi:MAG: TIGR00266 family protein [Bacteroidota bacterium]
MKCHEVDYIIIGDDLQVVEIELDPGETVVAEAGAMNWMEDGIAFETKMGDGSKADEGLMDKLFGVAQRVFTGESIFMTHFTNGGSGKKKVAFAAPYPGSIIPLNLAELGEDMLCQKDAFLCAAKGTAVSMEFRKQLGTGFFGGEGFILQRVKGDGLAFLHAGGTVIKKELKGEKIKIDTGCIVAFSPSLSYNIEQVGGLKSMIFGGEGLFFATLSGTGTVYLQSLPFSRLADRIIRSAPAASIGGGKKTGEGSVLGQLGNLFESS